MKKTATALLAFCVLAAAFTGCQKKEAPENVGFAFSDSQVAVTYVKAPLNVPSIVEREKGFFHQAFEGFQLPVSYAELTTGPEQTQALASGDIQFLNAVGATSVILSAANGSDIKIISMYSRSPKAFMLFAKEADITSPQQLTGKKIAGPKGTILHELLVSYLTEGGMTEKDVEFVSMSIPDAQAALLGGSVDAALLAGPAAYQMSKNGGYLITDGEGFVDAVIVTAASEKFCKENPALVEAFLSAQRETLSYIDAHYDECMELTAEETELSAEAVKEMYQMYDFNMEITKQDVESVKKTMAFMKENGMIEQEVPIDALFLEGVPQ